MRPNTLAYGYPITNEFGVSTQSRQIRPHRYTPPEASSVATDVTDEDHVYQIPSYLSQEHYEPRSYDDMEDKKPSSPRPQHSSSPKTKLRSTLSTVPDSLKVSANDVPCLVIHNHVMECPLCHQIFITSWYMKYLPWILLTCLTLLCLYLWNERNILGQRLHFLMSSAPQPLQHAAQPILVKKTG